MVRVPDEMPKAFVVASAGMSAQGVMEFVAERVASYKKVRAVELIGQIPRSLSGKILRGCSPSATDAAALVSVHGGGVRGA